MQQSRPSEDYDVKVKKNQGCQLMISSSYKRRLSKYANCIAFKFKEYSSLLLIVFRIKNKYYYLTVVDHVL